MMIRVTVCVFSFFLFLSVRVTAQEGSDKFREAMKAIESGKVLQGITILESLSVKDAIARELLGQFYPTVGEFEKAKQLRPKHVSEYRTSLPSDYSLSDAIDAIISEAAGRQIVIINEAHDAPEHRNFISRIAIKLKEIGFTHYAFETLSEDPERLLARGYPTNETGFYSIEPQFGELIRDAIRIGLTPIRYEDDDTEPADVPVEGINRREKGQSKNLVDRLFTTNPNARVLVHVGLDHAMEEPKKIDDKQIVWFAARLKALTGMDPLTVDQITLLRNAPQALNTPMVARNLQDHFFVGGHYKGYVDLQVFHPPVSMLNGRPAWLSTDDRRRMVDIPIEIQPTNGRLLVQARYAHESQDAIPADQITIVPDLPRPMLSLRPGSYKLETQNDFGQTSKSQAIVVK